MKEHFGLTDKIYNELLKSGVTVSQMFKAIPLFDPNKSDCEISKVSLMYFMDQKGSFNKPPFFPSKKIAQAVFKTLSSKEKIEILEYEELTENKFKGD